MPSLSGKRTENGRLYFGDKDAKYLKKQSREAVEQHHNAPILFFEVDWMKSKKNFYGEITLKKFKHPRGIKVRGIYKLQQGEQDLSTSVPNKTMNLTVSIYTEQLEELNIHPELGDYFSIGKRMYQIYDKTIEDVGPGSLMMNRGRVRQDFFCFQEDDENIAADFFGDNLYDENEIDPNNSNIDNL